MVSKYVLLEDTVRYCSESIELKNPRFCEKNTKFGQTLFSAVKQFLIPFNFFHEQGTT